MCLNGHSGETLVSRTLENYTVAISSQLFQYILELSLPELGTSPMELGAYGERDEAHVDVSTHGWMGCGVFGFCC